MPKKKSNESSKKLVSASIIKEIQTYRPLRLYIVKQRKKGHDENPLAVRSKFLQLDQEKQMKYFQKSVQKYLQLLEDKQIDEKTQIEAQLFECLLTKREQKMYFQSLNAPEKPANTATSYYTQVSKEHPSGENKLWSLLTPEEKEKWKKKFNHAQEEYTTQVKNFLDNLPERLQAEYLSLMKPSSVETSTVARSSSTIDNRRKSVQSISEMSHVNDDEHQQKQKLTRAQLDALHKIRPSELYFEKKVADDEKPTFSNATTRNIYVRSLFNQLSEKKRKKFILKATKHWHEYLESNANIVEQHVPTLHLLLPRNEDILTYFASLGLPARPPLSALFLFNQERSQQESQTSWNDLSQSSKDEYIKRVVKLKADYHENFLQFVTKVIPSDYIRLEFFRNVKHATKDYEIATKDRADFKIDDGQLKITQYLRKKIPETRDKSEFQQIHQQLLATPLSAEQKSLVERLGKIMVQLLNEKADTSQLSTRKKPAIVHETQTNPIVINGNLSTDEEVSASDKKTKKKRQREKSEDSSTISSKKRH